MVIFRRFVLLLIIAAVALAGCESMKAANPIMPIKEYERMIIGRLDADYVGTQSCLSACHFHDQRQKDFEASTMGAQLSKESGLPLVNCESCHGPGSLAIENLTPERVKIDAMEGKQTECNFKTFIDMKNLPPTAKSLICLKCHTANATFNLHDWNAGTHNINDVTCSDCHDIHAGPDLIVRPRKTFEMCFKCHADVEASFSLPSHHPVHEERVFCSDCHNPHGTVTDKQLSEPTIKATCTKCHAEKEGPFIYEHAENTETCTTCHSPHGSISNNLLTVQQPFLCLQCHSGHRTGASGDAVSRGNRWTRCTDCHSHIHGTDTPGVSGGTFVQ
ncbi:MAG: DmsE family decaheme c-type cytochrome [Nitrospirota bacterium]|nr:MAG: DmsE family decaheme c-type cytochrome [Nitrospirota bacterium]